MGLPTSTLRSHQKPGMGTSGAGAGGSFPAAQVGPGLGAPPGPPPVPVVAPPMEPEQMRFILLTKLLQTNPKVSQIIRDPGRDPGIRSPKGCGKITFEKINLQGGEIRFSTSDLL